MGNLKEIRVYANKITASGLEGRLFTTEGELIEIREFGPRDERGIPQGYVLVFDLQSERPFYDVVSVSPETDPFGSMEKSIRLAHQNIDTFVGKIESICGSVHERYLVFKRNAPGDTWHFNSKGGYISLLVVLGVIISIFIPVFFYIFYPKHYLFTVCLVSIVVYFLSVYFFHYFSNKKDFNTGQIRRAITTTFIFLFLATLPLHFPSGRLGSLYEKPP